jgi:hypothetical protein
MLRALAVAAMLMIIGCGDGAAPPALDMSTSVAPDFAGAARTCGVDNVLQACGGSCAVCLYVVGGLCATPCRSSGPSTCPSPQSCHALGGDGGTGQYQLAGNCANIDGYCG